MVYATVLILIKVTSSETFPSSNLSDIRSTCDKRVVFDFRIMQSQVLEFTPSVGNNGSSF